MIEPVIKALVENREFGEIDLDLENEVVLDVVLLCRIIRKEHIGEGISTVYIISENQTDPMIFTGLLHKATVIDDANEPEEE